jgi:ATP-binding protein involved in chromosome partitioning
MPILESDVLKALSFVDDPDLKKDLVTLQMVKNVRVEDKHISFLIELTTPACPMKDQIEHACRVAIRKMVSEDAIVDITMGSKVTTMRQSDEPMMPGVRNIIAVCSGKGGVGKSTVSVNLALGLAKSGARVGIMDADIYGPSIPIMLDVKKEKPSIKQDDGKAMMIPVEKHGIKILSIGFLVDDTQAVVWRGPMVSSALRQFASDTLWGDLDYLIIDLPPGTGDIHLTMVQTMPVTGALIVTTPQEVALADARKAAAMFNMPNIDVPILGVVENMSWFSPPELPENKYHIFGTGGGQMLADELSVPLLGQIPIVESIRSGGDNGLPSYLDPNSTVLPEWEELIHNTARYIAIRNEERGATKVVDIKYT